jgi:hypothetical protein
MLFAPFCCWLSYLARLIELQEFATTTGDGDMKPGAVSASRSGSSTADRNNCV